jgi:ribosomal protein S27AE
MSTCTAKHTKYQPNPDEWKCPKCGTGVESADYRGQMADGWIIQDSAEDSDDCELNHSADTIGCGKCGYECSGETFARQLQKAANMVPCEHCKGTGLVKKA